MPTFHNVGNGIASREHQNRNIRPGLAEPPGNLEAIYPRQHHVEQHKIELCILCEREGRVPVIGKAHYMALFFQASAEQLRHPFLVFDNQDLHFM
jgi:hypothetical protein